MIDFLLMLFLNWKIKNIRRKMRRFPIGEVPLLMLAQMQDLYKVRLVLRAKGFKTLILDLQIINAMRRR